MGKHIPIYVLAYTLCQMTGQEDVVTLLNRFGHCMSYSGLIELETALAKQVATRDSVVPSNISTTANKVCHLVWDNFDINEETPSGLGTTHSTRGIVVQELVQTDATEPNNVCDPVVAKTKERSYHFHPPNIAPCHAKKRARPVITVDDDSISRMLPSAEVQLNIEDSLWIFCQSQFNSNGRVPQ